MNSSTNVDSARYAQCLRNSKRIRWDIDRDVLRGRDFDFAHHFLPEGLSRLGALPFLESADARLLSQIQGRTYANVFGLVERFINAKVLELSSAHRFGDQVALEALVRFSDEELKHQEMFRRIEQMIARGMPAGYRFLPKADEVAALVLAKSTWAVLALTCHIELFTQAHYRESIAPAVELSPLYKDVFSFHWREESQHAILDELEWLRADHALGETERDGAVDDFIALVGAVDELLQLQAPADVRYFLESASGSYSGARAADLQAGVLAAYRWQYIVSGARHPRFVQLLEQLTTAPQRERLASALSPLLAATALEAAQ
ncbi:MAG TPA: diiron oxygenase [Polyangiaceae bacterium]|nr:diiron oxygenase [Polyangiaceae bacterium]